MPGVEFKIQQETDITVGRNTQISAHNKAKRAVLKRTAKTNHLGTRKPNEYCPQYCSQCINGQWTPNGCLHLMSCPIMKGSELLGAFVPDIRQKIAEILQVARNWADWHYIKYTYTIGTAVARCKPLPFEDNGVQQLLRAKQNN